MSNKKAATLKSHFKAATAATNTHKNMIKVGKLYTLAIPNQGESFKLYFFTSDMRKKGKSIKAYPLTLFVADQEINFQSRSLPGERRLQSITLNIPKAGTFKCLIKGGTHEKEDLIVVRKTTITTKPITKEDKVRKLGVVVDKMLAGIQGGKQKRKGRPEMMQSATKNGDTSEVHMDYLRGTEEIVRGGKDQIVPSFYSYMGNEKPAFKVLGPTGFSDDMRSITNMNLIIAANHENPLPVMQLPVERDYNNWDVDEGEYDCEHWMLFTHMIGEYNLPMFEIGGMADCGLGPVWNMLTFGGNETDGSHARAEASVASLYECKDMMQWVCHHCNLSKPETVDPSLIADPELFYRPYMEKCIRNGMEAAYQDGEISYKLTFLGIYLKHTNNEREEFLSSYVGDKNVGFEMDGEIWVHPGIFNMFKINSTDGAQFRAISRMTNEEVDLLVSVYEEWKTFILKEAKEIDLADKGRVLTLLARANDLASQKIESLIKEEKLGLKGYYKGLVVPINGLRENVILMDINAAKGRNKGAIKDAIEATSKNIWDKTVLREKIALGIIQTLGYDIENPKSIVPQVLPSWQLLFLLRKGNIEAAVRRHGQLLLDAYNDLVNDGKLKPFLKNILLSNKFIDMDLDVEDERECEKPKEEQDVLDLVVREMDNMVKEGINMADHRKVKKMIRTSILQYLRKGKFSVLPLGQTAEHFNGETRVNATRAYAASAIELPAEGHIKIGDHMIRATMMYHPDKRWWGKVGLNWRYPIMKETTVLPVVYVQPPEWRKIDGKYSSCCWMNPEAIKILFVGDTDGDQMNFVKYYIDGEESAQLTHHKGGFTYEINRTNNEDDYDLLSAYASILEEDEVLGFSVKQADVAYWMDEVGIDGKTKQPLQIDWSSPGIPAIAAHTSKKGVGTVALMYWGATALNGEIKQLKALVEHGELSIEKDGKQSLLKLNQKVNIKKLSKYLDKAETIINQLYQWAPLQGEASVCGAKYDTRGYAKKALSETLKGLGSVSTWCSQSGGCNRRESDPEFCKARCPIRTFERITRAAREGCIEDRMLEEMGAVHTVLIDEAIFSINQVRKAISNILTENGERVIISNDRKDFPNSDKPLARNTLHWRPRYGNLRVMSKIRGHEFLGRRTDAMIEVLNKMTDTPSFIHNIFTRTMDTFRPFLMELHGGMKAREGADAGNTAGLRIMWGHTFASKEETEGITRIKSFPKMENDGEITKEEIDEIKVLLKSHSVMMKYRVDRSNVSEIKVDKIEDQRQHLPNLWITLTKKLREVEHYHELRAIGKIIEKASGTKDVYFPRIEDNINETYLPENFLTTRFMLDGIPPYQVPQSFNTAATIIEQKYIINSFLELEAKFWKEINEGFYNYFDKWVIYASKTQIEVMWRLGHTRGLIESDGRTIVSKKGAATYPYGELLGLKSLCMKLPKFIPNTRHVLSCNAYISPLALALNINQETRIPSEGMIITVRCVREATKKKDVFQKFIHAEGPNGEKWFFFKKWNKENGVAVELLKIANEWFKTGFEKKYKIAKLHYENKHTKKGKESSNYRSWYVDCMEYVEGKGVTKVEVKETAPTPQSSPVEATINKLVEGEDFVYEGKSLCVKKSWWNKVDRKINGQVVAALLKRKG